MIELRKIDNKSKDKKLIKKIFVEAFPPEEYRIMIDEYLGPFIKKFISMKFINK